MPSTTFGMPSTIFGMPSTIFGTPSTTFGMPSTTFGMSSTTFGMSSTTFGTPSTTFGRTSMIFGMPNMIFGCLVRPSEQGGDGLNMATDPAKLKDYTFENLKNRVRRASKPEKTESKDKGEGSPVSNEK